MSVKTVFTAIQDSATPSRAIAVIAAWTAPERPEASMSANPTPTRLARLAEMSTMSAAARDESSEVAISFVIAASLRRKLNQTQAM